MAWGILLRAYSSVSEQQLWDMETWWWNENVLRQELDFKEDSKCASYMDFFATVDAATARHYASRFKPNLDGFGNIHVEQANNLEEKLADPKCDRVVINIFEWESGCGD